MSVPYHKELFSNGKVRLFANYSNIKEDIADENIRLHFHAIDESGNPIFTEVLDIEEIRSLYNHLDSISVIKDSKTKSSKLIETTDEIELLIEKLSDRNVESILSLIDKFKSEDKINGLLNTLSSLEIENLHGAYHHKIMKKEIKNLEQLISLEEEGDIVKTIKLESELSKCSAGQPEKIFQNWIEANLWIFGVDYIKKHDARKIALFSEADLLMQSADGYLDLIELKRPSHKVIKHDNSHKCFYPHPELSKTIGQSLFYIQKIDEYKLNIEKEYKIRVIKPRIKIIIGNSKEFSLDENNCLRMLNSELNSIEVITYNDLVSFGKILLTSNKNNV